MTYYALRLCSGKGAFEAIPRPKLSLDLGQVRSALEREGIPVTDARVLLIARTDPEATVTRDGRILIKSSDSAAADHVFERLRTVLGLPERRSEDEPATADDGPA